MVKQILFIEGGNCFGAQTPPAFQCCEEPIGHWWTAGAVMMPGGWAVGGGGGRRGDRFKVDLILTQLFAF